jgi:hypothetical protein
MMDYDIASMYPTLITPTEPYTTEIRILKNRNLGSGGNYYKWKIPTPDHFKEHEELFEI